MLDPRSRTALKRPTCSQGRPGPTSRRAVRSGPIQRSSGDLRRSTGDAVKNIAPDEAILTRKSAVSAISPGSIQADGDCHAYHIREPPSSWQVRRRSRSEARPVDLGATLGREWRHASDPCIHFHGSRETAASGAKHGRRSIGESAPARPDRRADPPAADSALIKVPRSIPRAAG